MGTAFGIVAALVALLGLLVALANVGYLAMLNKAAKQRGAAGAPIVDYVRGRWGLAGGTAAVAALALLLTSGGFGADVVGLVLGAGSGLVAKRALDQTRTRFRSQP